MRSRPPPSVTRAILVLLLSACAHQPPPDGCQPTRSLYVVDHGWHSGVVVERDALQKHLPGLRAASGKYLEIGWGEERFYQARQTTIGMALRAVLQPNPSVLQVVPLHESLGREVRTNEAGYAAALDFIAASFEPGLERLGPSLYGQGWFYRAEGSFHLFNTCNTWVAEVLKKAACSGP